MDLFEELESMAVNATDDYDFELEPCEDEVTRWQRLFKYSRTEAVEQIKNQKTDYSRYRVSNDHWDLVRPQKEAQGYSRDAYEHWVRPGAQLTPSHGGPKSDRSVDNPVSQSHTSYLILLEGILSTPQSIQKAASLPEPPRTVQAASERTGDAIFCNIDGNIKQSIETWLSQQKSTFRPTFVRLSKAKKDLDSNSIYPTLGLESTMPQHRSLDLSFITTLPQHAASLHHMQHPVSQDEYPVWYFFYGTLADFNLLTRLLSLPKTETPILIPARIFRGLIKTWSCKYKALVDGASTDFINGSAYEVTSKEREDALRLYETENYEVVRCSIAMASRTVQGLTFRFAGSLR